MALLLSLGFQVGRSTDGTTTSFLAHFLRAENAHAREGNLMNFQKNPDTSKAASSKIEPCHLSLEPSGD
jgi:hypothetical protein